MAKGIEIDIKVNGKMQKATISAKKLNDALKQTGKSAISADRQVKGLAQASANGSKNFAKMAQGITGGLVPAYAAFAAQVFALTAAFNFLKNAADLENLRKSQVTFAQSSGLAIKSVTRELRDASNGMLGFQEAAQAAAIGVAKGFSTAQLTELTEGAAKAAGALGRNFDDTFDRLLRGVSKAEPELLDELGITLRLEEATQRYADAIGKSRDSLTSAERSQAVFAETMRQLNDTFGDQEAMVNPFIQLAKTFEEIVQTITQKMMPVFTGLANLINENATAASIAFGALATMVVANIAGLGPALKRILFGVVGVFTGSAKKIGGAFSFVGDSVGGKISDAAKAAVYEIEFAELELAERLKSLGGDKSKDAAGKLRDTGVKSKTVEKLALGQDVTPRALGKLKKDLERVKKEIQDTGKVAKGAFAGATLEAVEELENEIEKIGKTSLTTSEKIRKNLGKGTIKVLDGVRRSARLAGSAIRGMGTIAKGTARAVKFIGKAFGVLGIIVTVVSSVITAMEKLAETPITVIDNFKKFLAGLIKGFQTALNLISDGLNKLLDNSVVRSILGLEEGERVIGRFTFADNIDEQLDAMEAKILTKLGTSRKQLQEVEDGTNAQREHEAAIADLRDRYKELAEEINSITSGINAQEDAFKKTGQIATGIATLPIAEAIRRAQKDGDTQAAFDELLGDVDFSAFGEAFSSAVASRDLEEIGKLQVAAISYNASLASIKNASASLRKDIGTGDPLGARILLAQLISTAEAGDAAAKTLGEEGGLLDLLNKEAGTDAKGLLATLTNLAEQSERIKDAKNNLAMRREQSSRAPGAVGRQQGLGFAAEAANLAVAEKQIALEQLIAANQNLQGAELLAHQQVVAQSEREIALLQQKAEIAEENTTEIAQLGMAVGNSLASGMQSAFDGLIQGTMTAKEAFSNMAQSMLQAIAKVITELLVAKVLTAALGGTGFGDFLGIGNRYGGVMSNGKKAPGYAVGGIASGPQSGYPAVLHGTEAIVPLPNGKSIPVEMQSGGQSVNNVTVNVSSDGGTQSSANNGEASNLGKVIAAAVQKELHNQKRAGGILNKHGAA